MITKKVSHYTLGSELGRGGMGVVYRAKDSTLDRTVAIKFLASELTSNDTARERFIREAKAAAAIEHGSICSIHEISETDDGKTYIVMPFYEGVTLKELIAKGKLSPSDVLDIGKQIASGLAAAHNKGVIHRDIKPGNIMVMARNRVIILDFGLAKLIGGGDLTRSRSSVGTLPYMAPEQLRGETVDQRTDIWGLGTVLYEMITGLRPFRGDYEAAVTYAILNTDPTPLESLGDDLTERFGNIISKCLAKNLEDRYATADELLLDLESRDSSVPTISTRQSQLSLRRFRRPTTYAIVTVAILGLVSVMISKKNSPGEMDTRHLAILEFDIKNPDQDADLEAFAIGVHSVIVDKLSGLQRFEESLAMVPMSSFDSPSDAADAKDRYGASHVLNTVVEERETGVQFSFTLMDVEADSAFTTESIMYQQAAPALFSGNLFRLLARLLNTRTNGSEDFLSAGISPVPTANIDYLTGLGYLVRQSAGDSDSAIEYLGAAIDLDSLFALAHAGLALGYFQNYGRTKDPQWLDEAIASSQRSLRIDDEISRAHFVLGAVYSIQGEHQDAVIAFDNALASDSGNAETYRLRGQSLRAIGQIEEAEISHKRAIDLAPNAWRFYSSIGAHYLATGQSELALLFLDKGLEQSPLTRSMLNSKGIALFNLGRIGEVVGHFDSMVEVYPQYARARKNLATAYFYSGEFELAAAEYVLYVEKEPLDYEARGFLADSYYWIDGKKEQALEQYRSALADAQAALRNRSLDPDILGDISWYYANMGILDSATVYLKRAEDAYSAASISGDGALGLGETYVILGELSVAKTWITQAMANGASWNRFNFSPWLSEIRADINFMDRLTVFQ